MYRLLVLGSVAQWYTTRPTGTGSKVAGLFCSWIQLTRCNSLWIVGGQLVDDPNKGVDDIYVLTMPAFQ